MFKIRKRNFSTEKFSNPNVNQRKNYLNRYTCLKQISDTEQHWKNLLKNELDMDSTIVAFQNVQISMRVDAKKKLILRQTFMLKKQIIRLIIGQKFTQIMQKLQFLRSTSPADSNLATLFINFYNIRQSILKRNLQYNIETIRQIKQKIIQKNDKLQKQKNTIIYGRTLYITALHLIKLNGVLIKNEDIQIIAQALNSKKKQLCMVSSEINKITLESLLFLTFQFYKILFLLKRDQDLIMQYFNQIKAFISIYKTKCQNYQQFQEQFKIAQKIQKMKPLNINLKIYDDHDRRRALSLQNTQLQLMKNHYVLRNANVLSTQINAQIKNHQAKKISLTRHNQLQSSFEKTQRSVLRINQPQISTLQIKQSKIQQQNQQILDYKKQFCFQFIKPCFQNILIGKFQAKFDDDQTDQFTVTIKLFNSKELIGYFTMKSTLQKKINLSDFAKKLWRSIKQKFYIDKTQFLPNLFSFQYPPLTDLPKTINTTYQLPILVRIHQILLHYLRKQSFSSKLNGIIIQFPKQRQQVQQKQKQTNQVQMKIFAKRHGFISFNKKLRHIRRLRIKNNYQYLNPQHSTIYQKQLQTINKIILFKKQQYQTIILYIQYIHQTNIISSINIYNKISNNSTNYLLKYKKLYTTNNQLIKIKQKYKNDIQKYLRNIKSQNRRKKILNIIQKMQWYYNQDYYVFGGQDFIHNNFGNRDEESIQEEFQVLKSPVLETKDNVIKTYRNNYKFTNTFINNKNILPLKTIKLQQKYTVLYQQSYPNYTRYFDNKRQFIIPKQHNQQQYQLVYRKFNIYKNVLFKKKNQNIYLKIRCLQRKNIHDIRNNSQIIVIQQNINFIWIKTKIIKGRNLRNMYYGNFYQIEQKIVVNLYSFDRGKKYYGVCEKEMYLLFSSWHFDQQTQILNNICLKQYTCNKKTICQIQQHLNRLQEDKYSIEAPSLCQQQLQQIAPKFFI